MRQLVPLAVVYALLAALILPGTLFAAEEQAGAPPEQPDPAGSGQEPASSDEPAPPGAPATPAAPATQPTPSPGPAEAAPAAPGQPPAGTEQEQRPVARAAAPGSVTIKDFAFSPRTITVNVGESVTWSNAGPSAHSATGSGFDTGTFAKGGSRSETFTETGTFSYICTPHPFMKGTVRVVAAGSGGGGSGSDSSGSGSAGGSEGASAGSTGAGDVSDSAAGEATDSGSGESLPKSGAEAEGLALLGMLMLMLGFATRRRTA